MAATDGTRIGPLFRDLPPLLPQGWKTLLWNACVQTSCAVARRADLGSRPFDPSLRVAEDRDLWIRLATNGVVVTEYTDAATGTMVQTADGGGHFTTGRYMNFAGAPHQKLLVSICQAMGLENQTFGDPTKGTGVLDGLA